VAVSGLTLGGTKAANYTLTQPTTTADITQRSITIKAASDTKIYDGTINSSGVPNVMSGALQGSDTGNFTQTFDTRNVGNGKTLTPAGSVNDGNGGNNYNVTFTSNNGGGKIMALAITVTAVATTKVYDATI